MRKPAARWQGVSLRIAAALAVATIPLLAEPTLAGKVTRL